MGGGKNDIPVTFPDLGGVKGPSESGSGEYFCFQKRIGTGKLLNGIFTSFSRHRCVGSYNGQKITSCIAYAAGGLKVRVFYMKTNMQLYVDKRKKLQYVSGARAYENWVETDKNKEENANDLACEIMNKSWPSSKKMV